MGPAKSRTARSPAKPKDPDYDTETGVEFRSDFEEKDEDLKEFLRTNSNFLLQMVSTAGFQAARASVCVIVHRDIVSWDGSPLLPILRIFQALLVSTCNLAPCSMCTIFTSAGAAATTSKRWLRRFALKALFVPAFSQVWHLLASLERPLDFDPEVSGQDRV